MEAVTKLNTDTVVPTTTGVNKSAQIHEISAALSQAQAELESSKKNNAGYGYSYSDLNTVIQTAKPILNKYGLAVVQLVTNAANGDPAVTTILTHSSGQYFEGTVSRIVSKRIFGSNGRTPVAARVPSMTMFLVIAPPACLAICNASTLYKIARDSISL